MKPRLIVLISAAVAIAYGYNVTRNLEAGQRHAASCERLEAEARERFAHAAPWLVQLFADDAAWMASAATTGLSDTCAALRSRLAWWRWNWGIEMTLPIDGARQARMRTVLAAARQRCPLVAARIFADLPGSAGQSPNDFAAQFCKLIDALDPSRPPAAFSPWAGPFP